MHENLATPIVFEPILKRILWGGRRLNTVLGKRIGPESDYAESWELADHAQGCSVVSWPPELAGVSLKDLVRDSPRELLGDEIAAEGSGQFPLLIKFLDAQNVLSLQVHPDDELARKIAGDNGKNEAWYVLAAEPGSRIYAGLVPGTTREAFAAAMRTGTVEPLVHSFEPRPGDFIHIPAGTVHAIGAGVLLAEIQQMSDATFRVDDWGRIGPDGKPRKLHPEEALAATDFARGPVGPVEPERIASENAEAVHENLVSTRYFAVDRWILDRPIDLGDPDGRRFTILVIVGGRGEITSGNGRETLEIHHGMTVLLPAAAKKVNVSPTEGTKLEVLACTVPSKTV
ncbi:mannose-6-phosphate isomerase [bacterium]|nr:mannose-6-phosphate isomerase [bacterium]